MIKMFQLKNTVMNFILVETMSYKWKWNWKNIENV